MTKKWMLQDDRVEMRESLTFWEDQAMLMKEVRCKFELETRIDVGWVNDRDAGIALHLLLLLCEIF